MGGNSSRMNDLDEYKYIENLSRDKILAEIKNLNETKAELNNNLIKVMQEHQLSLMEGIYSSDQENAREISHIEHAIETVSQWITRYSEQIELITDQLQIQQQFHANQHPDEEITGFVRDNKNPDTEGEYTQLKNNHQ